MKLEESASMHAITPASDARPVIVLLGGPGSGKGTHGQTLARALRFQHLSSGEHFRDHIRRATPLGLRARDRIEAGQLVPDEMAVELLREMLGSSPEARGFVLDGYPRSLAQAEALQVLAPELGLVIAKAVFLQVSDEEIVRRLSGRLTCRACGATCHEAFKPPAIPDVCDTCGGALFRRADDEPATIRNRIALFHAMTAPVVDFYHTTGLLTKVPAEGPANEVGDRVVTAVGGLAEFM
ncbi:MAG: adenylate kinase [Prosthecobacter sp.]|nr:adenylate kinase [Prosthecobacter sp.]